jgi:hypothetical protein
LVILDSYAKGLGLNVLDWGSTYWIGAQLTGLGLNLLGWNEMGLLGWNEMGLLGWNEMGLLGWNEMGACQPCGCVAFSVCRCDGLYAGNGNIEY